VHPEIKQRLETIVQDTGIRPRRALEVGGLIGPKSLLRMPELRDAERCVLNLRPMDSRRGITAVAGNANDMDMFADASFDLVLCNATLEHDKRFWLSVAEMHRVLEPGGLLVIGVPGYVKDPEHDRDRWTRTYRVHFHFDYYRFSEQAVREVFFEAMERVETSVVGMPPRIIGYGWKPRQDV
jgi:SAM-dependent methyltransferase